ncbi:AbiJ-NTD4 domain-containing protein [uncultured Tissierella sp.]|uniref:AbiJ-NTD4 domain-containing protein n=1 Tax=uncultured Tissierella sp. TaxID=448160 RepID=UPI00280575F2|nr:hypothetical protein [uncultured Tissierella sp.]MDU5081212.1 hypothetical protein [Bacillota bacterium]
MRNPDLESVALEVKWRGGFSDRNDYFPISADIQIESLDDRVRTRIYNYFMENYRTKIENSSSRREGFINLFLQEFYLTDYVYDSNYYGSKAETTFFDAIEDTIYKDHWSNVFTLIEFWAKITLCEMKFNYDDFKNTINAILEIEFVGYRLIDNYIIPISDKIEIESIEKSSNIPYNEVKKHISKALEKLSDRESPDYENSIKESISSVEAMAKIITTNNKATLGDALKKLEEKGVNIHPALKKAFSNLYGYTSDESGIRHSLDIGGVDSTFEEAKFMLVACSAFNNYLLSNSK